MNILKFNSLDENEANNDDKRTLHQPNNKGEIVLYQPDNSLKLEVRLEDETVWLSQAQIAKLFGVDRTVISKHLHNIFQAKELDEYSTCAIFARVGNKGKQIYNTKYYNLDIILSVGYRVNSINATSFRRWANCIIKDYLLRGYVINQRLEQVEKFAVETEKRVAETEKKIDFFVKTSLPPLQGVFFDGEIFNAYNFVSDLIRSAKKSIELIDNYVDDSVLLLLSKRAKKVSATIYTSTITPQFQLDLQKHNSQYPSITINVFTRSHDRFLCIDDVVYHIGASLKDLGKKWFAFSKMEIEAKVLLQYILKIRDN